MSSLIDLFNVTVFLYNDNEWNTKIKSTYIISYSFYFLRHARAAAWLAPGQGSGAVAAAAHLVAAGGWCHLWW